MKFPYTIRIIPVAFCLLLLATTSSAQTKKTIRFSEIMLNSSVSGNSFGVQRNPAVGITIGKRFGLSAGPTYNRGFQKNTGAMISARYFMVSDNESYGGHFRLAAVMSLHRMINQSLTKDVVALEQEMAFNMKNDEAASFDEMRYKGWEAAAGIGLAYRCHFGLMIRAEVALCYNKVDKQSGFDINSFHEENGSSLRLGFGIGWAVPSKKNHRTTTLKPTLPAAANAPALSGRCTE